MPKRRRNKKYYPSFYIAHTFGCRHYVRDEFIPKLQKLGIRTINPFYNSDGSWRESRPEIKFADQIEENNDIPAEITKRFTRKVMKNYEAIVENDLKFIREADGIIAYMPEGSTGTSIEIWTCGGMFKWLAKIGYPIDEFLGKKVFLVTHSSRLLTHPWLKYSTVKIFRTSEQLFKYLKKNLSRISQELKERRECLTRKYMR